MANSLPFNAVAVDGEYDRVYKAEDWAWYFATFIANGIFPKPSDGLQVVAYSGMEIRVNAGYAFINGYAFRNPATLSVTLDTAEGALNRVDRVVVRWDLPQRDMYIAVLKGTPSAKPTATAVTRTTEIWELALADIYVGKGVTRIQTQNITDQRFNSAVCGIVTGTVEEIDASVLTKQFTDFFNTYSAAVLDEFSAYKQSMEKYLTEIAGVYDSYVSKTEGLFAQYESQFNERYSSFESTLDNWDKELLSAYTEFMAKIKLFQSDAENEFNTWFESIKDKLAGDVAGALQNQIDALTETIFLDKYGLCSKVTTITKNAAGETEGILETDEGAQVTALTTFQKDAEGNTSSIVTVITPAYGNYYYTKTAAFETTDGNGSKSITESYTQNIKED